MPSAPASEYKVAVDVVRQLLQFGREQGLPVEQILADHRLDISPLPDQPAFVAGEVVQEILSIALRMLPDPLPGLYAARGPVVTLFGLAGFLVQTASTVGALLETLTRVEPLVGDTGITRLRREPGAALLSWDCRFTDPYVRMHAEDFILAAYAWGVLTAARSDLSVLSTVHLRHPPPTDEKLLQRYTDTFGCPVYFNQPEAMLILHNAVLDLPLPSADPQLHEVLTQHAQKLLAERTRTSSFADLARSRLHQMLHVGNVSRDQLATAMNMSARTLHRKLQEAGTSYRALLDELRLDRARTLLRDDVLNIQQIAEITGFDDGPSFICWFRHLTGTAPGEFRKMSQQRND